MTTTIYPSEWLMFAAFLPHSTLICSHDTNSVSTQADEETDVVLSRRLNFLPSLGIVTLLDVDVKFLDVRIHVCLVTVDGFR